MSTNEALHSAIAAELRAERARQMLTVRELGMRIGKPHNTVARWFSGETPISLADLALTCAGLGVTVADIVARAEPGVPVPPLPHGADRPGRATVR